MLIFLVQFAILLGLSKLAGLLFARFKQSTITGEVLVGLLLGPAIFGKYLPEFQSALFPKNMLQISMLETVAWIGNFYLLLETGLDVNFSKILKQRSTAATIAITDLIIPMLIVFIPVFLLPDFYLVDPSRRFIFSIFIGAIMTISALPVAIRVMYDMHILKTDTGFLIISALTINDLIGWVVFTIILGIFSQSTVDVLSISKLILLTVTFTVLSLTLFRKLIDKLMTFIHSHYGDDTGLKTTFIFIVGMLFGAITLKIGIHSLFGFFLAGIVIGEAKHFSENDRHVVKRLVHSVFVPVFFANIGLHLDFLKSFDWKIVLFFTVIGVSARYVGAYVGAKFARQDKSNLATIAICHTAGGEMHIVVALLAFSSGIITHTIFVGIVFAAILSTIIFGPWLSLVLKKKKLALLNVLFGLESIFIKQKFATKEDLLSDICSKIAQKAGLSVEYVKEEIQTREDQMSTAIGRGIAFPHARLHGITQPMIIFVRNDIGLEWDSPDGKPVNLIFFILSPEDNTSVQLYILQTLAKTLAVQENRIALESSGSIEEIRNLLAPGLENCEECIIVV